MKIIFRSLDETQRFAFLLGQHLRGGSVLELVGDVGTGKTTFTKGLAKGLSVKDDVQSPSFTISRVYSARDGLELHHYDFYRLSDPGIMQYDIAESTHDQNVVTVVEWAESVRQVLPEETVRLDFSYGENENENERCLYVQQPSPVIKEAYVTWIKN